MLEFLGQAMNIKIASTQIKRRESDVHNDKTLKSDVLSELVQEKQK